MGEYEKPNVPLDPAVGTGTFLREVIASIRATIERKGLAGAWPDYVRDHLLPRLFGFELLMAPYAICHLKLALEIVGTEAGVMMPYGERLNVFLTNTIEEPHETLSGQLLLLAHAIAQESASADAVKRDKPVMVVLGNPPLRVVGVRMLIRSVKEDGRAQSGRSTSASITEYTMARGIRLPGLQRPVTSRDRENCGRQTDENPSC